MVAIDSLLTGLSVAGDISANVTVGGSEECIWMKGFIQ